MTAFLLHPIPSVVVLIAATLVSYAVRFWSLDRYLSGRDESTEWYGTMSNVAKVSARVFLTASWAVSLWIIYTMIQVDAAILGATSPVCVMAGRPRLSRSDMRAERMAAKIRRKARKARAVRDNTELDLGLPEPVITDTGDGFILTIPEHGVIMPAFADYVSADVFRIRYMERARKLDRFPRKIG